MSPTDGQKYRLLIVDDEEDVRTILYQVLSKNYEVVQAVDGLDALQKLRYSEPDLVVLDVMMPLMDGFQACEAIRRDPKYNALPVLFLSALNTKPDMMKGYDAGANLFLTKPFDPVRLMRNIDMHLEQTGAPPRAKKYTPDQLQAMFDKAQGLKEAKESQQKADESEAAESTDVEALYGKGFAQKTTGAMAALDDDDAPPTPGAAARKAPRNVPAADQPKLLPRVMVVDDEEDIVTVVKTSLIGKYEVVSAQDGIEAIERIVNFEPDLILIDAMMPRMSGYQLCQSLRRNIRYAQTPVIFISGRNTPKDIAYAKRLGANDFLAKPFEIPELLEKLDAISNRPDFTVGRKRLTMEAIEDRVSVWDRERGEREAMRRRDPNAPKKKEENALEKFIRDHKDKDIKPPSAE